MSAPTLLSEALMEAITQQEQRSLTALVIVDVQYDFLPGGALAVPYGDLVIGPLLAASGDAEIVVATQDWHPPDHCSFVSSGKGIWPRHCVRRTRGAEVHPLIAARAQKTYRKGTRASKDAYSGFRDTTLARDLRIAGVTKLLVGGLATDYCVKATVLDALTLGFRVTLLVNACRGVNADDSKRALVQMRDAGARMEW